MTRSRVVAVLIVVAATVSAFLSRTHRATGAEATSGLNIPGVVSSEFIYEEAPFPSCHASTIVETEDGLVAAWFGGTDERDPDVGIWLSRRPHGADEWSAPIEVANGVQSAELRYPTWNPVLFQPRGGPLILFYKIGPTPSQWWGMLMTSTDHGRTWSQPKRLPDGILGPIKNKPVQLASGDILSPTSTEHDGWRVHFERSTDGGETWQATPPVNDGKKIKAIQPSLLLHRDNRLQAIGRTKSGRIFEVWSEDDGHTWGELTLTDLPNPSAGTDAVTLADGRHLLVYNHTALGRSPLNVAVSQDGKNWQAALILENEPGSEFSYPAVIQSKDGLVHITYTWKRQRIKHVVVDPKPLVGKPIQGGDWPVRADETSDIQYRKVVEERADKILASIDIPDGSKYTRVRNLIADQYVALSRRHDQQPTVAQEDDLEIFRLHRAFIARLGGELSPDQVEQVKDGMTYGVAPITYRRYLELLPELTDEQQAAIRAMLLEAREYALDGGSSEKKHWWFGKYKGRINNYVSDLGYNLKQAEQDLSAKRKTR